MVGEFWCFCQDGVVPALFGWFFGRRQSAESGRFRCHVKKSFIACDPWEENFLDPFVCSDITNDQLGISGETGHGGANICVY